MYFSLESLTKNLLCHKELFYVEIHISMQFMNATKKNMKNLL